MCGFLISFEKNKIYHETELRHLLHMSVARGPDKTQVVVSTPNVWMGFNRLAIQDISEAGNQPMQSADGTFILVFNGEIYNHIDIRKQLHFKQWRGHSDSETIVQAISEWGFDKTIEALDGMFAIACYDSIKKILYCARDFAGIKPFFYGWDGKTFIGASQYNQIVAHSAFRNKEVNPEVLRLYLEQHFMPAPFGLYKDTGQLEPGEILTIEDHQIRRKKYWEFPEYVEPTVFDPRAAMELVDEALKSAVQAEMIGDVPLGAFLSGGIDSPLICNYASQQMQGILKTFTIGSDSLVHDESMDAAKYATLMGTNHNLATLNAASIRHEIPHIMQCLTEPMADFSIIPTYLVSQLAKRHVTVALSGDGGDELFFGYERFWSVAKNIKFQGLPYVLRAALYGANKYVLKSKKINSVVLAKGQANAHQSLHSRFMHADIEQLFPHLKGVSIPNTYHTHTYANTGDERQLIQAMRKAEFYGMMQKTLRKVDLASMANSLEVRVPFLKKSFIEASLTINPMLSYGSGKKKELLKLLLRKKIPASPINNVKRGFSVPLGRWMQDQVFFEQVFGKAEENLTHNWGVDSAEFKKIKVSHMSGDIDHKWPLFTMLALAF